MIYTLAQFQHPSIQHPSIQLGEYTILGDWIYDRDVGHRSYELLGLC
jgi:hypothetical protein